MQQRGHTLDQLKKGEKARILKVNGENIMIRRRLFDMGITKDVIVTVTKIAPLGDPLCLSLRGYSLLVRKTDVKDVEVELIK